MTNQRKINKGLYVHIPFCGAICHYCDFVKFIYNKDWVNKYLNRLKDDLAYFHVPKKLDTIYVGGGTPTRLSYYELQKLLDLLKPYTDNLVEYTFEANVESITYKKLLLLKAYGVNRLSIGVQSTNDERLHELNRQHSYKKVKHKIALVKKAGFHNFSVDLIYGLPNQSMEELKQDIRHILKLDSPHISTYALTIEPNTVAFIRNWPRVSGDESRRMYDMILNTLRENGFTRYEVSNFAKQGFESNHNKLYWHNKNYYAIGLGASGYIGRERYRISGGLTKYLKGDARIEKEQINETMYIEEYFMLNLRLKKGLSIKTFNKHTGKDLLKDYHNQIAKLKEHKLIKVNKNYLYCTDEGIMLLDSVVLTLIS